jgi:cell division septal protein FtsQ
VKVIINPPKPTRKEYTNLPEREPHRDLLKERLEQRRKLQPLLGDATPSAKDGLTDRHATERGATFAPHPQTDANVTEPAEAEPRDFLADVLSDRDPDERETLEDASPEEQSWKNSRWVPFLFLGAIAILGGIWYFATHFEKALPLERVTVEGTHLLKDQEIVALAEINRDEKFYRIDLKQIEARLLRHSFIKSAHPRREVNPSMIVLQVEERQPVAILRSQSTGETSIIDRDGVILRPRVLAGLKDPAKLSQLPLISGVADKDTLTYRQMAKMIMTMEELDSGSLRSALGELRRTPTGAFVIYTVETQTPIFIGNPGDAPFRTAIEAQRTPTVKKEEEPLFTKQLRLLSKLWHTKLESQLRTGSALYVDARFNGQIIVKQKGSAIAAALRAEKAIADSLMHSTSVRTSPSAHGHQ